MIFALFEILSKGLNYFWVPFHTAEKCLDRIRTRERKREKERERERERKSEKERESEKCMMKMRAQSHDKSVS